MSHTDSASVPFRTLLPQPLQRRLAPAAIPADHRHGRTLRRELTRHLETDPLVRAGDQRPDAGEVAAERRIVEALSGGIVPALQVVAPSVDAEEQRAPRVRH
jgi:protocatechuate 3,4-dioxygenase beta subunit